ncbi:NYN domain-containing protein (plasmid) [Rossellomorea sp. AcN35-11]|nr:NYN domain-containing protein [Rossellomorea aquimaris]WJV32261.1 NYN domain-containing protein [Rossellomorea sp. AcN35-11]
MSVYGGFSPKTYLSLFNQFHSMGIEGINPWLSFYEATEKHIRKKHLDIQEVDYNIYGAVIPRKIDVDRHHTRKRFFKALVRSGINVHKAFCLPNVKTSKIEEKGVDMLLGLDIVAKAQAGIKHIYVFSADTDLVPAVQRAQAIGSKVTTIISRNQAGEIMRRYANHVLFLEELIKEIPNQHIVLRKGEIAL